jgi:hypothetical protein
MHKTLQAICLSIALVLPVSAAAHEFWIEPDRFNTAAGESARLKLNVGEYFTGELIPFTTPYVASLWRHTAEASENLLGRVQRRGDETSLTLAFPHAGTHLIAFDSHPNRVTLAPDKFHAYLHEEGLDAIRERREADGTAGKPGREQYRRHVKTLVKAGAESDGTFARRTGQRLEIVPLNDPLAMRAGETLKLRLFFDDRPLDGALVKAWHKRSGQTLIIRTHSDTDGTTAFDLPYPGPWMISVVHMIAAENVPDIDWESFWGNLTFELPMAQ